MKENTFKIKYFPNEEKVFLFLEAIKNHLIYIPSFSSNSREFLIENFDTLDLDFYNKAFYNKAIDKFNKNNPQKKGIKYVYNDRIIRITYSI